MHTVILSLFLSQLAHSSSQIYLQPISAHLERTLEQKEKEARVTTKMPNLWISWSYTMSVVNL